jgi:SAM domain (Sterile alpha motif)
VQEIGDWLEKLGMSEYGECFAQNKIDLSVLPHLTDQDLKDIGVPLGHRRKMLAAVAQLDDTSIAEAPSLVIFPGWPKLGVEAVKLVTLLIIGPIHEQLRH